MQLMQGDCLELMKDIPDGAVDMVLCDLPYGTTQNKWDEPISLHELWVNWDRICKENAAIVLFSQMPYAAKIVTSNIEEFRYEIIAEKSKATGYLNSKRMPLKAHENILVFYKKYPTYNIQYGKGKPYYKNNSNHESSNYNKIKNPITNKKKSWHKIP